MKPQVFVFMGSSGSGKGTQAKLLKEYLERYDERKVLRLETGEALRALSEAGSHTARLLKNALGAGALIPVFIPVWAWTDFLIQEYTGQEHVIFDGLARREIEAPVLDSAMEFYGVEHIHVLYIKTSDAWSTERLLERGRDDDRQREIAKRLAWFHENTMPAVEYFRTCERGYFHEINGEQTIEDVHQEILDALGFVK